MVLADDLAYADLYEALQAVEAAVHRPVNPNLMTPAEWQRKWAEGNPFVVKVAQR
jgi:hypothetical protein